MFRDGKPQAGTPDFAGSSLVDTVEPFEDAREMLPGDSRPVVLHFDPDRALPAASAQPDASVLPAVPDRVVHEIGHRKGEAPKVRAKRDVLPGFDKERLPPLLRDGPVEGCDPVEEDGKGDFLSRKGKVSGFRAGKLQEVVYEILHTQNIGVEGVQESGVGRRPFPHRILQGLQVAPDIGERGPQLVGGVRDEVALDLNETPFFRDVPQGEQEVRAPLRGMPHGSPGEEDGDLPSGRVERDLRRGDLPTAFPGVDESEDVRVPDRLGVRLSFPRGDGDPQETGSLVVDHAHRPPVRDDDHPLRQVFQEGRKPGLLRVQLGNGPFQVGGGLVESRGDVFQLVARLQAQASGTVSGGKLPGGFPDLFEGAGDVPGADGCAGQHQEKGRKPRPPGDRPDPVEPTVEQGGRDGGPGDPDDPRSGADRDGAVPLVVSDGDASPGGESGFPGQRGAHLPMVGVVLHGGDIGRPHGGVRDHLPAG